jgi:hypothetical protein
LLAAAFIPPSIPKILHRPFTVLPDSNPVGHYFNALFEMGFYYEFIGWSQIIAALLLIFPRTAPLGAMMFLPIIANIAVLTTSIGMKGTWLLTILMLAAAAWLLAWEYDRLRPFFFARRTDRTRSFRGQLLLIPFVFALGGIAMALLWKIIGLGNFADYARIAAVLAVIGSIFGLVLAIHFKHMRVGQLNEPS